MLRVLTLEFPLWLSALRTQHGLQEDVVRSLASLSGLRILKLRHEVARIWCRLAAAVPIPPLAWELPYAMGVTLKKKKKKTSDVIFPPSDSI